MKAIQERYLKKDSGNLEDSVAFVIFNVKGRDLMAIHRENEFEHEPENERASSQGVRGYEFILRSIP